ncbi:unnamed protein product [Chrysodeixis includens]|uniref:Hyaluronidase n=1 Tax=Chrysodeixis includens TaxID=689277 RepID=A0A9P0BY81_CHRIL|nr:unnamed protein product [Chrysodeixis includens]
MKTFLFIFLAGYAVRCDDSNYYVVQMPERTPTKEFKVYWNVPTMQCASKKIPFDDLDTYGIIQNTGDSFRGDKIAIMYDPGAFPALLENSTTGEIKYRNGGVPQEGDLIVHLNTFQNVLDQSIPDKNFSGVGIIDFESWRPVLRQNFGTLTPYKDVSYEIEKKRHWWWKKQWIEEEAKRRFEKSGREFMQATIALAKKMRPLALWGYYGFPYCFNMADNNRQEACAAKVPQENNAISWLWKESTALLPSVYSTSDMSAGQLAGLIRGRVREAARLRPSAAPILPYFWYRYRDAGFFNETDLNLALSTFYKSNASGFIIWGSSSDVNTVDKCNQLKDYVTNILGPAVAKYTLSNVKQGDEVEETYNLIFSNQSKYDPEYTWIPPVNYTQNIEQMVDQELREKNESTVIDTDTESILVDMILNKIANYCVDGCDKHKANKTVTGDNSTTSEAPVTLVTEDPFKNVTKDAVRESTTEEELYEYDATNDGAGKDFYDSNDYGDVSSIVEETSTTLTTETSTTSIITEGTSTSSTNTEVTSTTNKIEEESTTVSTSTEETSTYSTSTEGTTLVVSTTDLNNSSTTENNIENSSTDQTSTIVYTSSTTDNGIESTVGSSTTQSTDAYTSESTSLSTDESTSINTSEAVSSNTEESSTIYPKLEEISMDGAIGTNGTTGTVSGDGTTVAPVISEQVVVSVV